MNWSWSTADDLVRRLLLDQSCAKSDLLALLNIKKDTLAAITLSLQEAGFPLEQDDTTIRLTENVFLDQTDIENGVSQFKNLESIHTYYCTDSTNSRLSEMTPSANWRVAIAEYQTQGRGRRGREWKNRLGQSINLSLSREISLEVLGPLSLVVGVGVVDALMTLGVQGIGLKWPNDLVVQGSKLGGILVETQVSSGEQVYVVMGIGINYDLSGFDRNSVDWAVTDVLECLSELTHSRLSVTTVVLESVMSTVDEYLRVGFDPFVSRWQGLDSYAGKNVRVCQGQQVFYGIAQGVDHQGGLKLKLADGSVREFLAGDVSLRAAGSG